MDPRPLPAETVAACRTTAAERRVARWLLPDFSLLFSMVALVLLLGPLRAQERFFTDSDAGWHIRTGERILTGSFPRTDPYSFSRPGQAWYAWEWGADAIVGWAHQRAGLRGVVFVYSLVFASTVWLWFRLCRACGATAFLAVASVVPLLCLSAIHLLARPHLFGWLLIVAAMLAVKKAPARLRAWHVAAALCLSAVWTNVHASFFLAPLVCLLYAGCHVVRPMIWDLDGRAERQRARWFAVMAIGLALGSLLNPYGYHLHEHLAHYFVGSDMLGSVVEFQTYNFNSPSGWLMIFAIGVVGLGAVLALCERQLGDALLAAGLAALAIRTSRMLPIVGWVGLPVAAGAITATLARCDGVKASINSRVKRFLQYSLSVDRLDSQCGGWAVAAAVPVVVWMALQAPTVSGRVGFPGARFPLKVVEGVAALPTEARVAAPDWIGGYLIYRFNGERKVFFDGRSDFYGAAFVSDYLTMVAAEPGWASIFARYRFTHALLPNGCALLAALERDGWRRIERDELATLVEGPSSQGYR